MCTFKKRLKLDGLSRGVAGWFVKERLDGLSRRWLGGFLWLGGLSRSVAGRFVKGRVIFCGVVVYSGVSCERSW